MTDDITLTKDSYEVLKRVPVDWWDEVGVLEEIGVALKLRATVVKIRIQHLVRLRLVERRRRLTIDATPEIRRVGK
jgi:hypothetical protein